MMIKLASTLLNGVSRQEYVLKYPEDNIHPEICPGDLICGIGGLEEREQGNEADDTGDNRAAAG